jgi:SAM-dependent methyltransferase
MRTVSDWLVRRGYYVKTLDSDPALKPDYLGDIRRELPIGERFDLVLACEVFEHLKFRWLDTILENVRKVLEAGGYLVVSLPYTTLRFWPRCKPGTAGVALHGGRWGGRIMTGIPYYYAQIAMTAVRAAWRLAMKPLRWRARTLAQCLELVSPHPDPPEDRCQEHHWDLGFLPTTRRAVRTVFARHFTLVEETVDLYTNCVFFVARNDGAGCGADHAHVSPAPLPEQTFPYGNRA